MPLRVLRMLFGILVCGAGFSAGVRWNELRQQAEAAARTGQFVQAEKLLQAAVAATPVEKSAPGVAIWNDLGSVHHSQGLLPLATSDFERALALNAQLPVPDANQSAIALNNLATVAGEQHNPAKAQSLLEQASALLATSKQPASDIAALIHTNLALTFAQQERYQEAAPLYRRAATEVKVHFGPQSLEYSRLLTNESMLQLHTGQYREAVANGRQALEIQEHLPFVSVYDRALARNNLGFALSESGELAEAERRLSEAVRLWETIPENREQLISSINNLGALEEKQHKLDAARVLEERALQLLAAKNENSDLTRAAVLNNLGRIATSERNFGDARKAFNEACRLTENASGAAQSRAAQIRYAAVLSNLAALESAQKHYKRAESTYRKTLEIDEALLGPEHPEVAKDLSNIAAQMVYQKHNAQALELYERARTIAENRSGPVSSSLAHIWRNMAVAYYANKQFRESAFAYQKALETSPNPNNSAWLHEYALSLRKLQRFGEAEAVETRAVGIDVRNTLAAQKQKTAGKS